MQTSFARAAKSYRCTDTDLKKYRYQNVANMSRRQYFSVDILENLLQAATLNLIAITVFIFTWGVLSSTPKVVLNEISQRVF